MSRLSTKNTSHPRVWAFWGHIDTLGSKSCAYARSYKHPQKGVFQIPYWDYSRIWYMARIVWFITSLLRLTMVCLQPLPVRYQGCPTAFRGAVMELAGKVSCQNLAVIAEDATPKGPSTKLQGIYTHSYDYDS